jgi:hypothetical protein
MAVLGATTLTGCNSIPDFIGTGSVTIFTQTAAPTSWTRVTSDTADNRMLRVINSGNGGGVGGSSDPILNNVVPAHTHGFNTGGHSADHSHGGNTGNVSNDHAHNTAVSGFTDNMAAGVNTFWTVDTSRTTMRRTSQGSSGITANHFHGFNTGGVSANHTHSGTTDNGSSQTNWAPRYVNVLLCSKN